MLKIYIHCDFEPLPPCSENGESRPEAVIEHLVGRQGQPRGAQVHIMHLNDWNGWSQDPLLPSPHLQVGSGGEGISCWRSLPTWGLSKVSSSFPSFLHLWLLCLGSFSFAAAKDFTTLLLSWYFPSRYSIAPVIFSILIFFAALQHLSPCYFNSFYHCLRFLSCLNCTGWLNIHTLIFCVCTVGSGRKHLTLTFPFQV